MGASVIALKKQPRQVGMYKKREMYFPSSSDDVFKYSLESRISFEAITKALQDWASEKCTIVPCSLRFISCEEPLPNTWAESLLRLPFLLPASSRSLWAFLIIKSAWPGFLSMVWLKGTDAKRNTGLWQGCWRQRQGPQWWMSPCACCAGGIYILQWVRTLPWEYPKNLNEGRPYWLLFAPSSSAMGFNSNKTFQHCTSTDSTFG